MSAWHQTWNDISGMKNLERIRIDMIGWEPVGPHDIEKHLYQEMENYRNPQNIEIYVDWYDWNRGSRGDASFKSWKFACELPDELS